VSHDQFSGGAGGNFTKLGKKNHRITLTRKAGLGEKQEWFPLGVGTVFLAEMRLNITGHKPAETRRASA